MGLSHRETSGGCSQLRAGFVKMCQFFVWQSLWREGDGQWIMGGNFVSCADTLLLWWLGSAPWLKVDNSRTHNQCDISPSLRDADPLMRAAAAQGMTRPFVCKVAAERAKSVWLRGFHWASSPPSYSWTMQCDPQISLLALLLNPNLYSPFWQRDALFGKCQVIGVEFRQRYFYFGVCLCVAWRACQELARTFFLRARRIRSRRNKTRENSTFDLTSTSRLVERLVRDCGAQVNSKAPWPHFFDPWSRWSRFSSPQLSSPHFTSAHLSSVQLIPRSPRLPSAHPSSVQLSSPQLWGSYTPWLLGAWVPRLWALSNMTPNHGRIFSCLDLCIVVMSHNYITVVLRGPLFFREDLLIHRVFRWWQ